MPPFELVAAAAWPTDDPGCIGCEITPEQWQDIMRLVLEGKDVYLCDERGRWYPLELRHLTVGDGGLTEMLGLVKENARRTSRAGQVEHSHTTHIRPL